MTRATSRASLPPLKDDPWPGLLARLDIGEICELFQQVTDSISEAFLLLDAEGRILQANRAAGHLLECEGAELAGKPFSEICSQGEIPATPGRLLERAPQGTLTREEAAIRTCSGRVIPVAFSCALVRDKQGQAAGLAVLAREVSEGQRPEETRESQLYRAIAELTSDFATTSRVEPDGAVVLESVTEGFSHLTGYTLPQLEELGGWPVLVHPEDLPIVRQSIARLLSGEIDTRELRVVARGGETRWLRYVARPVRDAGQGRVVHILSAVQDITERKQAEEALRRANEELMTWVNELEQRSREIALLSEMSDLLQTCYTAEEAYRVIAQSARKLFPLQSGALCVLSDSRSHVEAVAVWGDPPPGESVFEPDDCWALRTGRVHLVHDPATGLLCRHVNPSSFAACLCVPMMAQGEALGVLHLKSGARPPGQGEGTQEPLADSKQRLAVTVADHIKLALGNLKLREMLRSQSIRDALTSLFNRRYMEDSLERELRRAVRNHRPLGTIMIDLDYFKRFNDTYGHDAGDTLLRELGSFLHGRTRAEDIACRYGGEEFTLILPGASLEVTQQRAEQLRDEVKHMHVQYRDQPLGTITLSLGVAVFPEHGSTAEALLRAADTALYRAKAEGRDRVALAHNPA